jgi:hypothetical protein
VGFFTEFSKFGGFFITGMFSSEILLVFDILTWKYSAYHKTNVVITVIPRQQTLKINFILERYENDSDSIAQLHAYAGRRANRHSCFDDDE